MRRQLAGGILRLLGWSAVEGDPVPDRAVIVAAPHTSSWDFFLLILFAWRFDVSLSFIGKHTIFWGPMGPVMRAFGGVPVDRSRPGGLVGQLAEALARADRMSLVVPAEGTRAWRPHWKSGFYRVAQVAGVPVSLSFLDYTEKTGGFGPCFDVTGDMKKDMDLVRTFYSDKRGRHPALFGPVLLADEEAARIE
ncbi:MAG: acyltransferase [bacterium]|nr:acyltransferase [bacterium]